MGNKVVVVVVIIILFYYATKLTATNKTTAGASEKKRTKRSEIYITFSPVVPEFMQLSLGGIALLKYVKFVLEA